MSPALPSDAVPLNHRPKMLRRLDRWPARKNCYMMTVVALLSFIAIDCSFPIIFCIRVANRPDDADWQYGPRVKIPERNEEQNPICVRDVTNGKDLGWFPCETQLRYCWFFAVSPDTRTLASTGWQVRLWDLSSGRELPLEQTDWENLSDDNCHFLAFTPDGKTLAGTNEKRIAVWDVMSGKYIVSFNRSWIASQIVIIWLFVTLILFAIGVGIRTCLSRIRKQTPARQSQPQPTDE